VDRSCKEISNLDIVNVSLQQDITGKTTKVRTWKNWQRKDWFKILWVAEAAVEVGAVWQPAEELVNVMQIVPFVAFLLLNSHIVETDQRMSVLF